MIETRSEPECRTEGDAQVIVSAVVPVDLVAGINAEPYGAAEEVNAAAGEDRNVRGVPAKGGEAAGEAGGRPRGRIIVTTAGEVDESDFTHHEWAHAMCGCELVFRAKEACERADAGGDRRGGETARVRGYQGLLEVVVHLPFKREPTAGVDADAATESQKVLYGRAGWRDTQQIAVNANLAVSPLLVVILSTGCSGQRDEAHKPSNNKKTPEHNLLPERDFFQANKNPFEYALFPGASLGLRHVGCLPAGTGLTRNG